jgi:hypothetical protein
MPRYVIYWEKKTDNMYRGNGTRAVNDENMVKRQVDLLNKGHPEIHHYYKSVSMDVPLASFIKN